MIVHHNITYDPVTTVQIMNINTKCLRTLFLCTKIFRYTKRYP